MLRWRCLLLLVVVCFVYLVDVVSCSWLVCVVCCPLFHVRSSLLLCVVVVFFLWCLLCMCGVPRLVIS